MAALEARLAAVAQTRLTDVMGVLADHLQQVLLMVRPTKDELRACIDFLTETGHHTDARRQEWILLADALGISNAVHDLNRAHRTGVTPDTDCGPFYRPNAPAISLGESICKDGQGEPMRVNGTVRSSSGAAIGGALLEVWQANARGLYENQEPDRQPEHNLRGRLRSDERGHFHFFSVKPGGYSLPVDGPVGQLLTRLGLPLARPAHINLRVSAPGFDTLTTQIFDKADPAIACDAIFGVKSGLLADFRAETTAAGDQLHALKINLVLAPIVPVQPLPGRSSK